MLERMRRFSALVGLLLVAATAQAGPEYVMSGEVWMRPKQGVDLLSDSKLRGIVAGLDADRGNRILIHYPGGEEGGLWAHELLSWLVALGVPSARIELAPGGIRDAALGIELVTGLSAESMEQAQ